MLAKRAPVSRLYEFGPFVLNAAEHLLTANGTAVPLPPKAFELLVVLVENNGSLVTKNDLLEIVWQDVSVEEGNIPYNVSLVRKALGDNAAAPRYVATVSKLGYRFIAPLKGPPKSLNNPPSSETQIGNNGRYRQEPTLDSPSGRLLSPPLKSHVWHLLAVSVLYALYYSVAFMLEIAYEYETYGTRALSITPVIFLWGMGTSLVGLGGGLRRTSRGATSGILFSLSIFIGGSLMLYLVLGLFLPNNAITQASFQTYPAQGAFLKSVYYVLPLVVLFVVLPFHLIVARECEFPSGMYSRGLELPRNSRSTPRIAGVGFLRTWWLAAILLGAFCIALLGTAHLVENLQSNPNSGLFIQLAQWRFLLYFLLGLECILWYQHAQRRISRQLQRDQKAPVSQN
jgi:DNA-binding winged helix-turn-helix (wHTH) protein/predicted secreted protein